jgi:hypothetical protein
MPTGVTVSRAGRLGVNFPRWGDPVDLTVAELKDGQPVPYPDAAFNRLNKDRSAESVGSVWTVSTTPRLPQAAPLVQDVAAPEFTLYRAPDQGVSRRAFRVQAVIFTLDPAEWNPECGDQVTLYENSSPSSGASTPPRSASTYPDSPASSPCTSMPLACVMLL